MAKKDRFYKTEEPYLILGESLKGSPLKAFMRMYVFSLDSTPSVVKNPVISKILYIIGIICTLLVPLYVWWVMEYLYFGEASACISFLRSERASAAVYSLITVYTVFAVLWLILKKGAVAALVLTLSCFTLAVASYFKYALTGDFVYPWDLIHHTGNLKELSGFVKIGFPPRFVWLIAGGCLAVVWLFFLRPVIRLKAIPRLFLAGIIVVLMLLGVRTPEKVAQTLGRFNMSVMSTANQETNHLVNGFTGGFLVNLFSMNTAEPEGYSKENVDGIMEEYDGERLADFDSPDVIVILSESFWNPKLLPNTQFAMNPIPNFEEIAARENSVSGYMYQTSFGGGTVRTEFEVITGFSTDYIPVGAVPWQYVTREIPTFATAYKQLGYKTTFLHTYNSVFYLRDETYPRLGFDDIYFIKDLKKIKEIKQTKRGNYVSDDCFVEYIEYILDKNPEKPNFVFGISMENHQPYEGKYPQTVIDIANSDMSDESIYATRNYTTGVYYADRALGKLVDYIDQREKKTLLVYFGDHLPNLNKDKGAYRESGFISKGEMTDMDWEKILRTPFLVYGNFPLENGEILDFGNENFVSSYNLLNGASELMGMPKTPFMEFLTDYGKAIPYYNVRLKIKPDKKQMKYINEHKLLTYDILNGNMYMLD